MENIEKIKELLPQGAIAEIARKTNLPYSRIYRVLHGNSKDLKAINAIADYYTEYKADLDKALGRITSLVN